MNNLMVYLDRELMNRYVQKMVTIINNSITIHHFCKACLCFFFIFFRWICKIVAEKAETDKRQYLQTFKLWSFTHLDNKLFICNDHLTSAESPIVYWFRRSLCMRIERVECYKASDWPDQNLVIFLFVGTTRSKKPRRCRLSFVLIYVWPLRVFVS